MAETMEDWFPDRPKLVEKDIVEAAKLLAESLGYSWDGLPDKCGPGFRMICERIINPNKQSFKEIAEALTRLRARVPETTIAQFDAAVATLRLHDGPRPGGKSPDWLDGQDKGIAQGLKIARSIVETFSASPEPATAGWQDISTAPKDGRDILLACFGTISIVSVTWVMNTRWNLEDRWVGWSDYCAYDPTHWQPLTLPLAAPAPKGEA